MKIICTEKEKEWILNQIDMSISTKCKPCPAYEECKEERLGLSCKAELDKAIEWEIIN